MPSSTGPSLLPAENLHVDVRGCIPVGLSGRMLGIGHDGVVHSVLVSPAWGASYQTQQLPTRTPVHNVFAFGGAILALSDESPAYELTADLGTFRVVDLAGQGRSLLPFPKHDPITGELHLVARAHDGTQSHVVVTAGALTRRGRDILDVSQRITDLALTPDRIVFVASGFVGIAPREGEARTTWIATGAPAPHPVHAHGAGDTVLLFVVTPLLERWTLHAAKGTVTREVLDPTPRGFAHCSVDSAGGGPRWLWTTGDVTICRHDLVDSRRAHHNVGPHEPGDFVVVADAARPDDTDGGWLVGLVHDASGTTTLRVFDAADIAGPAVATVRIPRPIRHGTRSTWIPSTQH
jgi:carotenoid cleavage dioxygenase